MLAKFQVCIVILSLAGFSAAWNWGPCPKIELQKDFDIQRYLGDWQEATRTKAVPFETGKCVYAKYKPLEDGWIQVNNTQINLDGTYKGGVGKAYQTQNPAHLRVSFYWPFYGSYKVLSTDYTTYSIVYSCTNWWLFHPDPYAWILARNDGYNAEGTDELALLESLGIPKDEFIIHDLKECPDQLP